MAQPVRGLQLAMVASPSRPGQASCAAGAIPVPAIVLGPTCVSSWLIEAEPVGLPKGRVSTVFRGSMCRASVTRKCASSRVAAEPAWCDVRRWRWSASILQAGPPCHGGYRRLPDWATESSSSGWSMRLRRRSGRRSGALHPADHVVVQRNSRAGTAPTAGYVPDGWFMKTVGRQLWVC